MIYYHSNLIICQENCTEIETAYGKLSRYYHNLNHLIHLINLALQYKNNIEDFETLLVSIFYHDFVYEITGKNNEFKSAEIAKKRLLMLNYREHPIFVSKSLKAIVDKGFSYPKSANLQNWDAPKKTVGCISVA